MSSRDLASLAIDLSPRPARLALGAVAALGLVGAVFLPSPWGWFAILAVLAGGFAQAWRLGLVGSRYALRYLHCDSDATWSVVTTVGNRITVRFGAASRVGANVVWLAADSPNGVFWLLLLRSSVPDHIWRGLQARLRWVRDEASSLEDESPDGPTS